MPARTRSAAIPLRGMRWLLDNASPSPMGFGGSIIAMEVASRLRDGDMELADAI